MPVVVVANPKGGVGKSTLSTQVAGYYANQGHEVMLGDIDRQQSSRLWLSLRPAAAACIKPWDVGLDHVAKVPKGVTHVVLDTPAGLAGGQFKQVLKRADKILVPLQPSVFDIFATNTFIEELRREGSKHLQIGVVGNRVDERTVASDRLKVFLDGLGVPVLAYLRSTQNYVHLAARGLTLFDVAASRVERDREQWVDLCRWLDA